MCFIHFHLYSFCMCIIYKMGMSPNFESQHTWQLWSESSNCIYISWVTPMLCKSLIISLGGCNRVKLSAVSHQLHQQGQMERFVWKTSAWLCYACETCSFLPLWIYMLFNEYCNIQHPKLDSDFSVQSGLIPLTFMN